MDHSPAGRKGVRRVASTCALFLFSLLLGALALPAAAQACSCVGPQKGESVGEFYAAAIKRSDVAVTGKVVRKRIVDPKPKIGGDEREVYRIRIRRAFKKQRRYTKGKRIRVQSAMGTSCAMNLKQGNVSGLLLYRQNGRLYGSWCGLASPRNLRRGYRHLKNRSNRSHLRHVGCRVAHAQRPAAAR